MKKILAALLCLCVMAALCPSMALAEEPSGRYMLGLGVSLSTVGSRDQNAQVDAAAAAVVLDAEGRIVAVKIDVAQCKMDLSDGEIDTGKTFLTKLQRGEDYGMRSYSPIGKEWFEQAEAFEQFVIGKTVEEIEALGTVALENGHVVAADEELLAGCTISIGEFKEALLKACRDWQGMVFDAEGEFRLGLAINTTAADSKAATETEYGVVRIYSDYAAVVIDKNGVILAALTDASQPQIIINEEFRVEESWFAGTKRELMNGYGMRDSSAIGKEWFEQAAAFELYAVGKTAEQLRATETVESGSHIVFADEELYASCSISIEGMIEVVAKAADMAASAAEEDPAGTAEAAPVICWEAENNDSFQNANGIPLNARCFGSLKDNYYSEKDWYAFTLDKSGILIVRFNTKMQGDNGYYWDVSIRPGSNPDDTVWKQAIRGYSTDYESMILPLSAGTYYFLVKSSDKWSAEEYALELDFEAVSDWEVENNDTFQRANRIALGSEYFGVLKDNYYSEKDWYAFTLDEAGILKARFRTKMQGDNGYYWDVSIRPGSNPDDTVWKQAIPGYSTDFESMILPLPAGTYYFLVKSSDKWSAEEYALELDFEAVSDWEVENNDTFQSANWIALDSEYFGVLKDYYYSEKDWYAFTLDRAATVTVQLNTKLQENNAAYWHISIRSGSNPDNKIWDKNINGGTTWTNEAVSLEAGTYYFVVQSSDKWSSDIYSFVIR